MDERADRGPPPLRSARPTYPTTPPPPVDPSPPPPHHNHQVVVGFNDGSLRCLSLKGGKGELEWATEPAALFGPSQAVVAVGTGLASGQDTKLFVASASGVVGVTRKGREFFRSPALLSADTVADSNAAPALAGRCRAARGVPGAVRALAVDGATMILGAARGAARLPDGQPSFGPSNDAAATAVTLPDGLVARCHATALLGPCPLRGPPAGLRWPVIGAAPEAVEGIATRGGGRLLVLPPGAGATSAAAEAAVAAGAAAVNPAGLGLEVPLPGGAAPSCLQTLEGAASPLTLPGNKHAGRAEIVYGSDDGSAGQARPYPSDPLHYPPTSPPIPPDLLRPLTPSLPPTHPPTPPADLFGPRGAGGAGGVAAAATAGRGYGCCRIPRGQRSRRSSIDVGAGDGNSGLG